VRYLNPKSSQIVVDRSVPMADARKKTIDQAAMPFSLVLDADTILPAGFLSQAHEKLQEGAVTCTLRYAPDVQGHPPFGASLWRTNTLKRLYDYHIYVKSYRPVYSHTFDGKGNDRYENSNPMKCECLYMYSKLEPEELYVFSDLAAVHLKGARQKSFLYAKQTYSR
jgi:hypothetical protein